MTRCLVCSVANIWFYPLAPKLFGENHPLGADDLSVGDEGVEVHARCEVLACDGHAGLSSGSDFHPLDLLAAHVVEEDVSALHGFRHSQVYRSGLGERVGNILTKYCGVGIGLPKCIY